MKGKQIQSMQEIFDLADAHKAVWFEKWQRHVPAYIIQQAGARDLHGWIRDSLLFTYIAKQSRR